MPNSRKFFLLLLATIFIGSFTGRSHGALALTFNEIGNDVVVTTSGSLDLSGLTIFRDQFSAANGGSSSIRISNSTVFFDIRKSAIVDLYDGGVFQTIPVSTPLNFGAGTGDFISLANNSPGTYQLAIPSSTPNNGVYAGTSTWTFLNTDISSLGFDFLSTTPRLVWTNPNVSGGSGDIVFVLDPSAVPEPSSSFLLTVGGLSLAFRRSRR